MVYTALLEVPTTDNVSSLQPSASVYLSLGELLSSLILPMLHPIPALSMHKLGMHAVNCPASMRLSL